MSPVTTTVLCWLRGASCCSSNSNARTKTLTRCRNSGIVNFKRWGLKLMLSSKRKKRFASHAEEFVPKRYQKECIRFGISRTAAGFLLAPGLGKTAIILFLFKILKKLGFVDELIVIGKLRIIYTVWPAEIEKWGLDFRYRTLHGNKKEERIRKNADVWLVNYEGMRWVEENQKRLFKKDKRYMVVCDESSKIKNSQSKRFKILRRMLHLFDRRYILTGSPVPNSLQDIFSQAYFLDGGKALGEYITHFRNKYFYPSGFMGRDWQLQPGAEKRIFKRLRPIVIRYGNEELNLPPLTPLTREVTLPKNVRKKYHEMEKDFITQLNEHEVTSANAAVASGKLRQIANGGLYLEREFDARGRPIGKRKFVRLHDEKCENLLDLIEELNGEPTLVFYEFVHDLARLRRYFPDAPAINKGLSLKDTKKVLRRWNAGKIPVLFAQTTTAAHGLNMQGSGGIVVFYSMGWNLEEHEQAIARVWRQGQKRRVLVYRIVAKGTVDEDILDTLGAKDRTQKMLLHAMRRRYRRKVKRISRIERRHNRRMRRELHQDSKEAA